MYEIAAKLRWTLGVITALAVCTLEGDADAQKAKLFVIPGPTSPRLPPATAPALPAGCVKPTLDQCTRSDWYATDACARDRTKSKPITDYCTWVLLEEWRNGTGATHPTLFPSSPPSSPSPILLPGRPIERGRNVVGRYVPNRASTRRSYGGATPKGTMAAMATPATLDWTPKRTQSNGGSYTSQALALVTPSIVQVDNQLETYRTTGLNFADATLNLQANTLLMNVVQPVSFMTPGPGVTNCLEYAGKHWGDYTTFSLAAKKLGRNYRQIYNIAMDPQSPVFFNKPTLLQTGTNTPTEKQIREVHPGGRVGTMNEPKLFPNAFFLDRGDFVDAYNNVAGLGPTEKAQIKSMIAARWSPSGPVPIKSSRGTPLGVHEDAKVRLDTVYGNPNDDELEDASKRAGTYQKLVSQRVQILERLECASGSDPCWICRPKPNPGGGGQSLPGGIQRIKDMISGAPVINPADFNPLLEVGNPAQRYRALEVMTQIAPVTQTLAAGMRGTPAQQNAPAVQGSFKNKTIPLAQIEAAKPPSVPSTPGPTNYGINACAAELNGQRLPLQTALIGIERKMAALLVNELKFGARGCLANPGPDKTNLCDWSYELFGSTMASLMDSEVETSFQECRVEVSNAAAATTVPAGQNIMSTILRTPEKQELVYPCVWRQDYAVNAPKAKEFMTFSGDQGGRTCEIALQTEQLRLMQASITNELRGLEWTPGEEKIGDTEEDGIDVGDQASLRAYALFKTAWEVKSGGKKSGGTVLDTCKFDGKASTEINVGVGFFGRDLKLLYLNGSGNTKTREVRLDARYRDFDNAPYPLRPFNDKTDNKSYTYPVGDGIGIPLAEPPVYLGGDEASFWVFIGPVPVHIVFGAFASAGFDYNFNGASGENCASAGLAGASNFKVGSVVEPWARGDAYADASVDVVVASAGIRLDLLLLRLGLPIGVDVQNVTPNSWKFKNSGRISIDLLTGKLTAYAEAGVAPLEASWEETVFRWDGFHTDVPIFSVDKGISNEVMRIALAPATNPTKAKCACTGGAAPAGFCCSELPCLAGAPCAARAKVVSGQSRVCAFTKIPMNSFCDKYQR